MLIGIQHLVDQRQHVTLLLAHVLELEAEILPHRVAQRVGSRVYLGVPYRAWKHSGIGREECFEELLSYTRIKNVNMRW